MEREGLSSYANESITTQQSHLVPGQIDVSACSSRSSNKMAVGLWKVGPERTLLVPVHAEVENTNTHTHKHTDTHAQSEMCR